MSAAPSGREVRDPFCSALALLLLLTDQGLPPAPRPPLRAYRLSFAFCEGQQILPLSLQDQGHGMSPPDSTLGRTGEFRKGNCNNPVRTLF